ncbi:hypothetical protein [Chryseobacterium artocarpi]|uniref:hypothetical protein n=1 Tax=Chryseobacterium artocarpi TaxID=1414727 RepID=UPI003F35BC01
MIEINKIVWLSEEAKEAEIHLSDGNFNLIAFSHPFTKKKGDKVPQPLYALNVKEIFSLKEEAISVVKKNGSTLEQYLSGYVIDKINNHVKIGEFIIEFDTPLPNDIEENDYISFCCDRIDIY